MTPGARERILLELRTHSSMGQYVSLAAFAAVAIWGGTAKLAGAVVSPGRVAIDGNIKAVQHPSGGVVVELPVRNGDRVALNQVVARLDPTVPEASARATAEQFDQLQIRRLRLMAESVGNAAFVAPDHGASSRYEVVLTAERQALQIAANNNKDKKAQLLERIAQLGYQRSGAVAQLASVNRQLEFIQQEYEALEKLYALGYAPLLRRNEKGRERENLSGQQAELSSSIARMRAQTNEVHIQLHQIDTDAAARSSVELQAVEMKLAELRGAMVASDFALGSVSLRAPVAGRVHQLAIHTKGGVVAPGETLMHIVPADGDLVVEAQVEPSHIDSVSIGRRAFVRFTALSAKDTPELLGLVDRVSPAAERDDATGRSFYTLQVKLGARSLPEAIREKLVPGMPVEVQIETLARTPLNYLLKPLSDQLHRSFKED